MENLLEFWSFLKDNFDPTEIENMLAENEIDPGKLEKESLKKRTAEDINLLFANLVYAAMNELFGGDFGTMQDVLLYNIGLDEETVNDLLDF